VVKALLKNLWSKLDSSPHTRKLTISGISARKLDAVWITDIGGCGCGVPLHWAVDVASVSVDELAVGGEVMVRSRQRAAKGPIAVCDTAKPLSAARRV
jgi:hypothetical protein